MNWLDIVLACCAGAGLLKGLYDGMIKQVVALAAMVVGIYLCTGAAEWLGGFLGNLDWIPKGAVKIMSYFLGFVLIVGVVLLAGNIVGRLVDATPLSIFNHLVGGIVGVALMLLFLSLVLNIFEMFDAGSSVISQETKVESRFYYVVKNIIPSIFPGNLFVLKG